MPPNQRNCSRWWREIVTDVGGRGHAGRDRTRRAARRGGRLPDRGQGPLQDPGVRKLQDEPVRVPPDAVQRTGPIAPRPTSGDPNPVPPTENEARSPVVDALPRDQPLDHPHRLDHLGEGAGLSPDVAQRRVAPPDAADRARAVDVVQRREGRGEHRPVAAARIRHHRADHDPFGLGQDPGEDDEGLLPEHRRVEDPHVGEAVDLGPPREVDHPARGGIGLQDDTEIHHSGSKYIARTQSKLAPGSGPPAYQSAAPTLHPRQRHVLRIRNNSRICSRNATAPRIHGLPNELLPLHRLRLGPSPHHVTW